MTPIFLLSGAYVGSRDEPRLQLTLQVKDMNRHAGAGAQVATSDKRRCLRVLQPQLPQRRGPRNEPHQIRDEHIQSEVSLCARY